MSTPIPFAAPALVASVGLKPTGRGEWSYADTGRLAIWSPSISGGRYVICPRGETVRMDPKTGEFLLFDTPESAMEALLDIETAAAQARLAGR